MRLSLPRSAGTGIRSGPEGVGCPVRRERRKGKVATPVLQEYYSGAIGLDELRGRLEEDGNLVLARCQR